MVKKKVKVNGEEIELEDNQRALILALQDLTNVLRRIAENDR